MPPTLRSARPPPVKNRRSARLYNGMTQMSSVIIVTVKPSVEYAKLCMSMCLGNARYSGRCGRRSADGSARRCG